MQRRTHYSDLERLPLLGGLICADFALSLSACRRASLYGSRTDMQRLGTMNEATPRPLFSTIILSVLDRKAQQLLAQLVVVSIDAAVSSSSL